MRDFWRCATRAAVAVAASLLPGTLAHAQEIKWVPGKRYVESSTRVMGAIANITEKTEYGYTEDICLLGAFLTKNKSVTFVRGFDSNEKYAVVGGGDDGVKDLDIHILDAGTEKEVVADTKVDATPVVEFKVPKTGRYIIKVVMADARDNGGFATIGILRKGGYTVPIKNLAAALGNLIEECLKIDKATSKSVLFNSSPNQWAVYGSIIKQGDSMTITGLSPGAGTRVWVTGGDTTAQDLDLYLLDSDGDVVAKDEDDDPRPVLAYQTKGTSRYGFRIKNVKSKGPSLVLTGVLMITD